MRPTPAGDVVESVSTQHSLLIDTSGGWSIRIEGDCTLHRGGETIEIVDERFPDLEPAISSWVGQALGGLEYDRAGDLVVRCGQDRLVVPASSEFEAWGVAGPWQEKTVCLPGGEVSTWDAV